MYVYVCILRYSLNEELAMARSASFVSSFPRPKDGSKDTSAPVAQLRSPPRA